MSRAPKPIHLNNVKRVIEHQSKLPNRDRLAICDVVNQAVDQLRKGGGLPEVRSLMYAFNMAEALSDLGICSDRNSKEVICGGQIALRLLIDRHRENNSWTLRSSELLALTEAAWWHCTQLSLCSLGEYLKSKRRVDEFMERNS